MSDVWQVLVGNLATVALLVSVWTHISYRLHQLTTRLRCAGLGVTLGLASVASMTLAVQFDLGIIFDLRLAIIMSAAVFGGPGPAVLAACMAALYRLYLGGAGVEPGLIAILMVTLIGCSIWIFAGRRPVGHPFAIVGAALLTAVLSIAVLFMLPEDLFTRAVVSVGLPIAALNFATTAAIGFYLAYFRKFTVERDILYAALTQTPDYHYVKDIQLRFAAANINVAQHNGRTQPKEMIGLTDLDLNSPERGQALMMAERAVLATGVPLVDFEELLMVDGKDPRWYSTSKVPLCNPQGELIGLAGVTVDITQRKSLEQELRSSRHMLAQAMAEMSDGLAMFSPDGRLLFCNENYRIMFPRSAYARLEGAHITDVVRAMVRNGERNDLPMDLSEDDIKAIARRLLVDNDEVIPMVDGRWLSSRTRTTEDQHVLALVSDITAMKEEELSLRRFADRMKGLAETDALTGLANRRVFDEALIREFKSSQTSNRPLSLLLIDVDWFKRYNDKYGHLAGDACLKAVAECLGKTVRRSADVAARFGGEEFAVLLPDTDGGTAAFIGDKIREAIKGLHIRHEASDHGVVTVSIGTALLSGACDTRTPAELVAGADLALYAAKDAGRDCVRLHASSENRTKLRA